MELLKTPIRLPAPVKAELKEVADTGWINIHRVMSQFDRDDPNTMEKLLHLLRCERSGKKRPFVLHRLYRAYADMRRQMEERALYGE